MKINNNSLNIPFDVWLGEDGPTPEGLFGSYPGTPRKKRHLFHVPLTTDPEYPSSKYFFTNENINVDMFSGHSYGYIIELEGSPSLPISTPTLNFVMSAAIYFGGAGT